MPPGVPSLPYFDRILELLSQGDAEVTQAFGEHVHWGYWDEPRRADGTLADYAAATNRLSHRVIESAGIHDGERVLDVGCGLGGTLANLNQRYSGMDLFGLNIDERQLSHARKSLMPRSNNRIRLVTGDACRLPFADASFDTVLCVEAIFHFSDRERFFSEVHRVLRPDGRFAMCDFVPRFVIPWLWDRFDRRMKPVVSRLYGPSDMRCTLGDYRRLGRCAGIELVNCDNLTRNTLPTYSVLRPLIRRIAADPAGADQVIRRVEFTTRIGLLQYLVLLFRKS